MKAPNIVLVAGVCTSLLVGCGSSNEDELTQWMSEQRSLIKPGVEPLTEPKKFIPQTYSPGAALDPFSNQRLIQSIKRDLTRVADNAAMLAPELVRRREALESFPLDTFAMVGSLFKTGQRVALVRVDKLLYQVHEGNYLGQNYGRVTKIGESELTLREIVQDSSGEWVERMVTLQLEERSKK